MNNIEFIDAESDYKSESNSIRDIIMRHLERIASKSAFELYHGGHYETRYSGGTENQYWVPDGKDVYCSLVQAFTDILFPFFDEEMHTEETRHNNDIEKLFALYKLPKTNKESIDQNQFKILRYMKFTKLFRALCSFLKRKRFLEVGALEQ